MKKLYDKDIICNLLSEKVDAFSIELQVTSSALQEMRTNGDVCCSDYFKLERKEHYLTGKIDALVELTEYFILEAFKHDE